MNLQTWTLILSLGLLFPMPAQAQTGAQTGAQAGAQPEAKAKPEAEAEEKKERRVLTKEDIDALTEWIRRTKPKPTYYAGGRKERREKERKTLTREEADALAEDIRNREYVNYAQLKRIRSVEKKLRTAFRQAKESESSRELTRRRSIIEEEMKQIGEEIPAGNAYLSGVIQDIGGNLYSEEQLTPLMDVLYASYKNRLKQILAKRPDGKGTKLKINPQLEAQFDRIDKKLVSQCVQHHEFDSMRELMRMLERQSLAEQDKDSPETPEQREEDLRAQEDFREIVRQAALQAEIEETTGLENTTAEIAANLRVRCMRALNNPALGARRVHAETRLSTRYRQAVHESGQIILRRLFDAFKKARESGKGQRIHGLVIESRTAQGPFIAFLCRLAGREGRSRPGDRIRAEKRPDFVRDLKHCAPWKSAPLYGGARYVHERHRWENQAGENRKLEESYRHHLATLDRHEEHGRTLHRKSGLEITEALALLDGFEERGELRGIAIERLRQDARDLEGCLKSGQLRDQTYRKDIDEHYFTLTTTRAERLAKEGRLLCKESSGDGSDNGEKGRLRSFLERFIPD